MEKRIRVDRRTNFVTIKPAKKHTASMIIIHGLGDSAFGWADTAAELAKANPHVKFILPTAEDKPVTVNGGEAMPSWYDIIQLGGNRDRSLEPCHGIEDSRKIMLNLIREEVESHGIPHDRVVLGGFSQGGAMSLFTGLQMPNRLAGIMSLSGYIPKAVSVTEEAKKTPVFFGHGTADQVVQFGLAKAAHAFVRDSGCEDVEFHEYKGMQHSLCGEELNDMNKFVRRVIPDDVRS